MAAAVTSILQSQPPKWLRLISISPTIRHVLTAAVIAVRFRHVKTGSRQRSGLEKRRTGPMASPGLINL